MKITDYTEDTERIVGKSVIKFWGDNHNGVKLYWDNEIGDSCSVPDPDQYSAQLKADHQALWSGKLPNGDWLILVDETSGTEYDYLVGIIKNDTGKEKFRLRFGSDYITTSCCWKTSMEMIKAVKDHFSTEEDYKNFMEDYTHKTRTIGGEIIFPRYPLGSGNRQTINQARGKNYYIKDRFDLTLECIRRYYQEKDSQGEDNPLFDVFNQKENRAFFDLFIKGDKDDVNNRKKGFENYVRYFYLDDWVSEDFQKVKYFIMDEAYQDDPFKEVNYKPYNPFPQNPKEYIEFVERQIAFVNARNQRIAASCEHKK